MKPLNGEHTHPLSEHALAELRNLTTEQIPCCSINPGVVNRLTREELAAVLWLPSPFKTHKGKLIPHLGITMAGRTALSAGVQHK